MKKDIFDVDYKSTQGIFDAFNRLYRRVNGKDFGSFGKFHIKCNSNGSKYDTPIPHIKPNRAWFSLEQKGVGLHTYIELRLEVPGVYKPLRVCFIEYDMGDPVFWICSEYLNKKGYRSIQEHSDAQQSDYVVAWEQFLYDQGFRWDVRPRDERERWECLPKNHMLAQGGLVSGYRFHHSVIPMRVPSDLGLFGFGKPRIFSLRAGYELLEKWISYIQKRCEVKTKK